MTESQLLDAVIDVLHAYNYRVAHFRPALTVKGWRTPLQADATGWPDIVAVKPGTILTAELKSERGRLTTEQAQWGADLTGAGVPWHVWRPQDLQSLPNLLRRYDAHKETP